MIDKEKLQFHVKSLELAIISADQAIEEDTGRSYASFDNLIRIVKDLKNVAGLKTEPEKHYCGKCGTEMGNKVFTKGILGFMFDPTGHWKCPKCGRKWTDYLGPR